MDNLSSLPGIRGIDRILNIQIRELYDEKTVWIKVFVKSLYDGCGVNQEWGRVRLLKDYTREIVKFDWIWRNQGEWCMTVMNGGDL